MKRLNVLVLCERRGTIREAFADRGHHVTSVDLLDTTTPTGPNASGGSSRHIVADAGTFVQPGHENYTGWDLVIARPTCTYLTNAGVRWLFEEKDGKLTDRALKRWHDLSDSMHFFNSLWQADTAFLAIENPIPHKYAREGFESSPVGVANTDGIGAPAQVVQPWMFGHTEKKGTGWWLRGLPKLRETNNVKADMAGLPKSVTDRVHYASPGPDRWSIRSLLVQGMADAIADQWGSYAIEHIDWSSSASSQGYIETGRRNTLAETAEFAS